MVSLSPGPANDTIFALASGVGRSAIAVVRLSGRLTRDLLTSLCGTLPEPRMARLSALRDKGGSLLDRAIVLWMPGPASYTGEDSAELHLHGGRAVIDAVMSSLVQLGARPADAGEFTRRAFLGGKMDLLAAEAVADLVDAETELQRTQALRVLSGEQARVLNGWAEELTRHLAWQEALIDFPDESLPDGVQTEMLEGLGRLRGELTTHLEAAGRGERLRRGLVFVILGEPNVGKSSILNCLAGTQAAIVSPHPGTTRDTVTVDLALEGIPVTLVDTAGLRDTDDDVEAEGVRRARHRAAEADLVIHVSDAVGARRDTGAGGLYVRNKVDLAPAFPGELGVSALTGHGIPTLVLRLTEIAQQMAGASDHPALGRARHISALRDAITSLLSACRPCEAEVRAEELRLARAALGRLVGDVEPEAVLDIVFAAFCIGK